jgi:uncharacterized protein YndB with AHSA1/START domain
MLVKLVIILVVVIAVVLVIAATRPSAFRIQRSTAIRAPAAKVFANLDDFHRWESWSPWEKLDPALRRTFSGAERGPGAVYEWAGNSKVGKGKMAITEAVPPTALRINLDFLEPFEAHNVAEFTLAERDDSTTVNWAMLGNSPYMWKVMGLFMNMDRMIGKDFEKGLANLKTVAEA